MNTFMYIEKRLIDLGQEQKAKLVHAANDEEKACDVGTDSADLIFIDRADAWPKL